EKKGEIGDAEINHQKEISWDKRDIETILNRCKSKYEKDVIVYCLAKVSRINTKSPWYYNSCLDCTQKPLKRATDFWCFKCSKAIEKQLIRYRIELCVEDKTETTIFTILDSEAKKLIGQDAMTLYDDHLSKIDEDDEDTSPIPELIQSSFIGKEFLFKLKITNYNHDPRNRQTFTLIKIMDKSTNLDKSIID
ncbi:hypothetical protein RND81_14G159300, partial [Saponaria officinalis]